MDDPVKRGEIDAFKASFRIPPDSARNIARLFDNARDTAESFEPYAAQLGESFADNRGLLEDVLRALFVIARADGPLNGKEQAFLRQVHRHMGLDAVAWERAAGGQSRAAPGLEGEERMRRLEETCEKLTRLGARQIGRFEPGQEMSGGFLVMQDPEGNEFCLD